MSMSFHSYPNCCSGVVLYGFYAKTKEEQLDSIYKLLCKTSYEEDGGRNWYIDGHFSAVTTDKQLPGRAALDEIGFMRNSDDEQYVSKRHGTTCCHHSISVEKMRKWFETYAMAFEKRHEEQMKAQKTYKTHLNKVRRAMHTVISNV